MTRRTPEMDPSYDDDFYAQMFESYKEFATKLLLPRSQTLKLVREFEVLVSMYKRSEEDLGFPENYKDLVRSKLCKYFSANPPTEVEM